MSAPEQQADKPKGQAPVYKDGDLALFLNVREVKQGERAGTTYEVYTAVKGQQGQAPDFRVDISKRVAGYDLTPSEAAAIALGHEIVVERESKNTSIDPDTGEEKAKTYLQVFGPLPLVENKVGDKIYTRLPVGHGFAHFSKPENPDDQPEFLSFTVNALKPDGTEDRDSKGLETYRFVGPKTNSIKVWVADAYAARAAISKGETYAIELQGVSVPLKGAEPSKRANGPMRMAWANAVFLNEKREAAQTPKGARVA